jgi:hypothetical protein
MPARACFPRRRLPINASNFDRGPSGTAEGTLVQWELQWHAQRQQPRSHGRVIVGSSTGYPYPPGGTHIQRHLSITARAAWGFSIRGAFTGATVLDKRVLVRRLGPGHQSGQLGLPRGAQPHQVRRLLGRAAPSISPSGTRIVFGSSWGVTANWPP